MLSVSPELGDAATALLASLRVSPAFNLGKSILVTSTQPSEGKTTVACCLAIAAALAGQAVLLVDGDLRQPRLAAAAGIADGIGLGEALDASANWAETVHPIELFGERRRASQLSLMVAGQKSPSILPGVNWSTARAAFQSCSELFGIVLVDSPPILAVSDALLLAGLVDGVLLVVDAGAADRYEVRRAKQQLESIKTPIIGAVLNQFNPNIHGRPIQPYGAYYFGSRR
jgi:polysaccharide biosynthesis transport protein